MESLTFWNTYEVTIEIFSLWVNRKSNHHDRSGQYSASSLHCCHTYKTIPSWEDINDTTQRPAWRWSQLIYYEHEVVFSEVILRLEPFVSLLELMEDFRPPSWPKVLMHVGDHVPSRLEVVSGITILKRFWQRVNLTRLLASWERGKIGRELRHASIFAAKVAISSYVSLESPITFFRWLLKQRTADSHKPPKWGVQGGMKLQSIPFWVRTSAISVENDDRWAKSRCQNRQRHTVLVEL